MDYYSSRKRAIIDIIDILKNNDRVSLVSLNGKMLRRYGFGDRLVKKLLLQFEKEGSIEIEGDFINVKRG